MLRRRRPGDYRVEKLGRALSRITRHFPAVHMTWGAINELSTLTGYQALAARAGHPLLSRVLVRIVKDERRHFSFYFNQARRRLRYRAARILTASIVRYCWAPVGSRVRTGADLHRVCAYLFGDQQGPRRLAEHDAMIARLPGLEWFDLGTRYCLGATLGVRCPHQLRVSPHWSEPRRANSEAISRSARLHRVNWRALCPEEPRLALRLRHN
jgi:hypothetical protein